MPLSDLELHQYDDVGEEEAVHAEAGAEAQVEGVLGAEKSGAGPSDVQHYFF